MTDEEQRKHGDAAGEGGSADVDDGSAVTDGAPAGPEHDTAAAEDASKDTAGKDSAGDDGAGARRGKSGRQLSISLRSLLIAGLIVALIAGLGVVTWQYVGAKRELDVQARQAADTARAEQIALDYATNAAAMNYQDIPAWKAKLVAGTSPELNERLSGAADQMEQILVPLQWNSTARPLAAKVRSQAGSGYTVDAFVSVLTKTVQGPDPLQSTATYSVTIDSNQNWQITDVGGIDAAVKGP